ncbi:MAG: hypothetical protein QOI12_1564 [Alphaproteobacteria bacterium]|jgi:hypothetical protein|nr:hypothetical protein [Alphaproteobacteria bacterium]
MRNYLLAACAVASILAAPSLASAQPNGAGAGADQCLASTSEQVKGLLARFRSGGPALRAAVARLVEEHPELARDLVAVARRANPAQKAAIGAGLADAANYFAKCGSDTCRGLEGLIRTSLVCADEGTRVGFLVAEAPTLVQGIPGFNNAGAGPARISPSRP